MQVIRVIKFQCEIGLIYFHIYMFVAYAMQKFKVVYVYVKYKELISSLYNR